MCKHWGYIMIQLPLEVLMAQAKKKDDIHLRVQYNIKKTIEKAAKLKVLSLTDYILSFTFEQAKHDLEESQNLHLSKKDRDLFFNLLENPPEPTELLIQAMKEHSQKVRK